MTRKEKINTIVQSSDYTPQTRQAFKEAMNITEKSEKRFFKEIDELIEDGIIIESRNGKLFSAKQAGMVKGILRVNPKGFGFVVRSDGEGEDLYVSEDDFAGAINGDTVLAKKAPVRRTSKDKWMVHSVLRRGNQDIVGTLKLYSGLGIVVPDNEKLPREVFVTDCSKASDGQKVVVRITDYPRGGSLNGRIVEVLGYPNDFGIDVLSIIKDHGFETEFPKKVLSAAEKIPEQISPADIEGRLDLRDTLIITIDGDDSKDLDDAVSLEKTKEGYRLGVHIADVSNYVLPMSPIDKEALARGTSVYLVDRVIPMLPQRLSNGICSLNEGVDRLTLSVIMDMDENGEVKNSRFRKSIIRSAHRMTYSNVWKLLCGEGDFLEQQYADILPMLKDMYELSLKLKALSRERGYIELNVPEAKAVLDSSGRAIDIKLRETNGATELIEQFMICANMTVAEFLWKNSYSAIYRIHDLPDEEKISALRRFAAGFGLSPKLDLQSMVEKSANMPEGRIISAMTLRSMAKAKYSPKNTGHYGLGLENYCHFTSPIRRYPDLVCHRAIKAAIEADSDTLRAIGRTNAQTAESSSEREMAAEHCERDVLDMKKAQYMEQFIGQDFEAVISGVTNFGFFVSLPNTVEGLVSINSLADDYYIFDEDSLTLIGEHTRRQYRIGDQIDVTLVAASSESRKVEFVVKGIQPRKFNVKEEKTNVRKREHKNSGSKQKRVSRVFHRRKNRGRN